MDVSELERQIEYKFAPAPLIALQALANTYSFEDDEELLLDPKIGPQLADRLRPGDRGPRRRRGGAAEADRVPDLIRSLMDANLTGEQDREANETLGRLAASTTRSP